MNFKLISFLNARIDHINYHITVLGHFILKTIITFTILFKDELAGSLLVSTMNEYR